MAARTKLIRGFLGACVGLFFGSALCSTLETLPLAAVAAQSLLTLAGIALGAGYPSQLAPLSDRAIDFLGKWVREPVGRRTVSALLSAIAVSIVLECLKRHVKTDPFTAGYIPLLLFYGFLGIGLGWPDRVPKAIVTLSVCGAPAAFFSGVMTYDRLCNFGHAATCAATPEFGWFLWSGLGFLALLTGGLIMVPLHLFLPIFPIIAIVPALSPETKRRWAWGLACAVPYVILARPSLDHAFFMNFFQCAIPAVLTGFVIGQANKL